jgi:hypothetical protein
MTALLALTVAVGLCQWLCGRLARRAAARMMRPADEWDAEDTDRWLALIEPFPLPRPTPGRPKA